MNWNPKQQDPYSPPHGAFQPQQGANPYGHTPYVQNPYGQNPYGPQPPRGGASSWLWIVLGVGGGLFVCCLGCCGVFALVGFGELDKEDQQVKAQVADDPVIVEHIGDIVSIERDWSQSIDEEDMNIWYFRVVGTKGEGDLIVKEQAGLNLDETEIQIEWAKLRLASGEELDVLP